MLDRPLRNRLDRWLAIAIAASTFFLLFATLDSPAFSWDEGYTFGREAVMRAWFGWVFNPPAGRSRGEFFSESSIVAYWPFAREEPDGHPPFYAFVGNVGWWLSHFWLPQRESHRIGPAALFSVTTGIMYLFMARRIGRAAGAGAVGAWFLTPRVFAHAHLGSYDAPLACLWFLAVAAFWKAREQWQRSATRGLIWSVVFAATLAAAAATKFTGWLIPLPLMVWSGMAGFQRWRRDGTSCWRSLVRVAICLAPLIAVAPYQWILIRNLRQPEFGLTKSANEDTRVRATRAAEKFRKETSTSPWNALLFLPVALWCATALIPTLASKKLRTARELPADSCESRQRFSPTAEVWAAAALAPAITILLVPTWWHQPLRGIAIFLWSNLSRQQTTWIPTQFFGPLYEFSLPWYNSVAWVFLTTPPPTLLFIGLGLLAVFVNRLRQESAMTLERCQSAETIGRCLDSPKSLTWLLVANAATLLVIRALPGAPGHDGERQLLGSFPFLACLAGIGVSCVGIVVARLTPNRIWPAQCVMASVLAVCWIWSAHAIWHYRTAPLSYYTEAIGGLRGAVRLGLEPTYYWDALDDTTLDWLNRNTGRGEKLLFCNYPMTLEYLSQWGILRVPFRPTDVGMIRWYVLQNRPGLFLWKPADRWLAENGQPAFVHELDGVPLIWIFPFHEYERAIQLSK